MNNSFVVRSDLREVETFISRLLFIGEAFNEKDRYWSHLKNNEDWERCIYPIKDIYKKNDIERLYSEGRGMALGMTYSLHAINYDVITYPSLTSIINEIRALRFFNQPGFILEKASTIHDELQLNCWAFVQMTELYKEQLRSLDAIKETLKMLENSDLYKKENNIPVQLDNSNNIHIAHVSGSNISIQSQQVKQYIEASVFDDMIDAVKASDIELKEPLITAIENMKNEHPKGGLLKAYEHFMAIAADHITVVTPLLPALIALL
ncbi:MAG: hypothetical protein ACRDA6_10345 [Aeromonas veronii]